MPFVKNAIAMAKNRFDLTLEDVHHMEGQLGGLAHAETRSMLVAKGLVLKPVQSETRGLREVAFYEYVTRKKSSPMMSFLCNYHGVVEYEGYAYLALDDCRRGMRRPCTIDVKIGTRTYEDDAPREKRLREAEKYPPQAEFGCRIVGMRIAETDGGYATYDKHFGYGLQHEDDLLRAFQRYFLFSKLPFDHIRPVIAAFLQRLETLRRAFDANNHPFIFISSSLFFVYDAESRAIDLRLIDFAHVRYDANPDDGCLVGVHTLINVFRRLLLNERLPHHVDGPASGGSTNNFDTCTQYRHPAGHSTAV